MRNVCFILIALLLSVNVLANNSLRYGIIPTPSQLIELPGSFTLNKKTLVVVDSENKVLKEMADDFILQYKIVSGQNLKIVDTSLLPTSNFIEFKTTEGLADEAYELIITPDKITIKACKANGFFYGIQTIYQLLPPEIYGKKIAKRIKWEVPCCKIQDAPQFSYRGLMLDVCRFFMPKEFILKLIDMMAMHKQNMFHWHLTDDQGWRIEIKKYPRLTEIGAFRTESEIRKSGKKDGIPHGGFYTQEDVKEIVEYARKRYVTVVPEIELPGHATAAIASYPHLACVEDTTYEVSTTWGIKKDVFCPKATTFQFFEDVFTELFDLFPSPYYHIGGDECPRDRWKACEHCQNLMKILGLKNEDELQIFLWPEWKSSYEKKEVKQLLAGMKSLMAALCLTPSSWLIAVMQERLEQPNKINLLSSRLIVGITWIITKKIPTLNSTPCLYLCRWKKRITITRSRIPWRKLNINLYSGNRVACGQSLYPLPKGLNTCYSPV